MFDLGLTVHGAIIAPLNGRAKADEVEYCVWDADSKTLVYESVSQDAAM